MKNDFLKGRKYDKNGQKLKWWTNETISKFEARSKCFNDQYANYYVHQVNQTVMCIPVM